MHKQKINLLFEAKHVAVAQCDDQGLIYINWRKEEIQLSICSFLAFRNKLKAIDIEQMLEAEHPGVELMNLACIDRIWLLDIFDILNLKEAMDHSLAMLEVNSFIHSALVRTF